MAEPRTVRWIVHGRVQGVAYRWYTQRAAQELGLKGWVRNRHDGTVELEAAGPTEALDTFRQRLQQGPPAARVTRIEEQAPPADPGWTTFEIRR